LSFANFKLNRKVWFPAPGKAGRRMFKLIEELPRIEKRILGKKFLFMALDYDGTLTPIVSHPDQARLQPDIRSLPKLGFSRI
jgi:hypothetical protein